MALIKAPMDGCVTAMNLFAAIDVTRSVDFACVLKRNAAVAMML